MRNLNLLDLYRDRDAAHRVYGHPGDHGCGVFNVPSSIDKGLLTVVASDGGEWDHVSVSRANRCPNWPEMEHIKRLFFKDDEVAMQLHVPPADHLNMHPYCLHLWRPQNAPIPRPPGWMVAPASTKPSI
jgi:hypothetical protein